MSQQPSRYRSPSPVQCAEGWTAQRLTPPSRLFGANGLRAGPDGRIYVAQVAGSQISAVDVASGSVETISPLGGAIVAPDDLAFGPDGNLYVTEISEGRVAVRTPAGETRVVYGDLPCANPITVHQGRLLAGECRPGGRIMELDLNGGAPRIIADNVPMPNAMEVGPDGKLYFPVMGTNEIWRVDLAGGEPEKVAGDLGLPDAVKFDADGCIVSTQGASGQVLRIDPRTGERTVLASLAPGLDNLTFVDGRLFVSSFSGEITEVLANGNTRALLPGGFTGPMGLALGDDGVLFVADGPYGYFLPAGGTPQVAGMLFTPGCPGYSRCVAALGNGDYVLTSSMGQVSRWRPREQQSEVLAQGFDRLYGVAVGPGDAVVFVDAGSGRVHSVQGGNVELLAEGLREPKGVAVAADGSVLVTEEAGGRVVRLGRGGLETVLDGLVQPQGIAIRGDRLYVVDIGRKELIESDLAGNGRRTLAAGLPVGAPAGVTPPAIGAFMPLSGSMGPFAGIAAGPDGTLYLAADAEGSVIAVRPQ